MIKLIPVLLLFFTFSFLFRSDPSFDQDLGRHIKLGEIILQTKEVPLINLFSYTYPNFPFINSHWLFEVFMYLGSQTIGLQTILVLKTIILLSSVWLILSVIPKKQYFLLPVGFIFLHLLRERLDLRPEIFSFLFTAVTIYILNRFEKEKTKLIYLLPVIQFLWVNTHIYFILGIIIQAIFIIHLAFDKKIKLLILVFIFSVALCFLNPSGYRGVLNPFLYGSNYGYTIVENQTMMFLEGISFRDPNFLFMKLALAISILSIIVAFFQKKISIKNLGLIGSGLTLALLNVRSFPYAIFLALPPVLENFGNLKFIFLNRVLLLITIPIIILESFLYLNGDYYKYTNSGFTNKLEYQESGKKALDFVLANKLPAPIFNNFDIGSYITYRAYPKYPVFVDGRPGEYPKEFFSSVYIPMQTDQNKFKEQEEKYGFKTIIFSHTDQTPWGKSFLGSIAKDDDWNLVYLDDFMVIYTKKEMKQIKLSEITPSSFNYSNHVSYLRIALFLMTTQNTSQANLFYNKALEIFPDLQKPNNIYFW